MKIRQVVLKTSDLRYVGEFYRHLLGCFLISKDEQRQTFCLGSSLLTFELDSGAQRPFYHFAINIPPNLFTDARFWLAERTPLLTSIKGEEHFHFEAMNADAVYFRDPAGNIGELIARNEAMPSSEGPFEPARMLGISEIGLPVRDVSRVDLELRDQLGLEEYIPATASFAASGNADGMFILVPEGRGWMPDGTPAEIHPLSVVIDGEEPSRLVLEEYPYEIHVRGRRHA